MVSKHVRLKKWPFSSVYTLKQVFFVGFAFVLHWNKMLWVTGISHLLSFGAPMQKTFLFLVLVLFLPPNIHWMPVGKLAVAQTVASCFAGAALGLFKNYDWLSSSTLMMTYGDIPFAKMWLIKKGVLVAWWIEREHLGKLNLLVLLACVPPEAGMGVNNGHEGWIHKARRLAITEKFGISLWCFSCGFISFLNWTGLYKHDHCLSIALVGLICTVLITVKAGNLGIQIHCIIHSICKYSGLKLFSPFFLR